MAKPRLACPPPAPPPVRPRLSESPSQFILLEREVQQEFRSPMLARLQEKVNAVAAEARATSPLCPQCARPMSYHDTRPISWLAHWGRLQASASRYRCTACKQESRPLLDLLGVEPGRISGSLARLLALPPWRRMNWRGDWRVCCWESTSARWESGEWRSGWAKRPPATAMP
ncbi:MAG: hypothetical protein ACKV2U_00775 [Bryobacteraceae bacterium]